MPVFFLTGGLKGTRAWGACSSIAGEMVATTGSIDCSAGTDSEGASPGTGDFERLGRGGTTGTTSAMGVDGDSTSSFVREGRGGMDGGEVMTRDFGFSLGISVMELAVGVYIPW